MGTLHVLPKVRLAGMEELFRHRVLGFLLVPGKIRPERGLYSPPILAWSKVFREWVMAGNEPHPRSGRLGQFTLGISWSVPEGAKPPSVTKACR